MLAPTIKERPILFSAPMVRAILDGRKTQTRRICKPQPPEHTESIVTYHHPDDDDGRGSRFWPFYDGALMEPAGWPQPCRYGAPGDRLWVRETWARYEIDQDSHSVAYRATPAAEVPRDIRWRPSIHMPRNASRITLAITDVRVERLQEITEEDARVEGVTRNEWEYDNGEGPETYRDAYACLWDHINGRGSWDENPWVWVIEFRTLSR
jgi:hypothetical protein